MSSSASTIRPKGLFTQNFVLGKSSSDAGSPMNYPNGWWTSSVPCVPFLCPFPF